MPDAALLCQQRGAHQAVPAVEHDGRLSARHIECQKDVQDQSTFIRAVGGSRRLQDGQDREHADYGLQAQSNCCAQCLPLSDGQHGLQGLRSAKTVAACDELRACAFNVETQLRRACAVYADNDETSRVQLCYHGILQSLVRSAEHTVHHGPTSSSSFRMAEAYRQRIIAESSTEDVTRSI